jgi:NAD(P) transhydrogenase subunit alpha
MAQTMGSSAMGQLLGAVAIVLAMINVVGGFLVTDRMLRMFKK